MLLLGAAFTLPVATMLLAQQAGAGRAGTARPQGPCDVYAAANTPCVAAHSTTRALYAGYNGPLYQVLRPSDGKTLDIGVVQPNATDGGGYADAAAQDAFCANALCVINRIYDQSGKHNDLMQAPPGPRFPGPAKGGFDTQPIADMAPVTLMGHKVYGVFIMPGMGFRNSNTTGVALNDDPEGMYSVMDGTHYDSGCCFDYGNAETNSGDDGAGTMENTYFGTSTTWGSGAGRGPWIMADMEAGVYSGYNAHQNLADPTIDSWRFVTAVVDGGGGNKWDLRGGNSQHGGLSTFYSGPRPGSNENNRYFPMHKQGGILLGTGGDNGNGSSGTFYEGAMTVGYPPEATTDALQANIVAAKYDVQPVNLSRIAAFTPGTAQDVIVRFTNTTGAPVRGVNLKFVGLPSGEGWSYGYSYVDKGENSILEGINFADPVAPGASVTGTFRVTAPAASSAGFLTAKAQWTTAAGVQSDSTSQRVRSAPPIKINELQLVSPSSQFIELYNAGADEVDISNWSLIHTPSQWAAVKLATIPAGTKLSAHGFYLLGQSTSGLAAPAQKGDTVIYVRSAYGLAAGQEITVDGEKCKIASVGTPAAPMTTVFIPVTTGPWITFPAGATNLALASTAGFAAGEKAALDLGGNYEIVTVTAVGKPATQTTLSVPAAAGASTITIGAGTNIAVGDSLTVGTGAYKEIVVVKGITLQPGAAGAGAGAAPGGPGRGGRGAMTAATIELAAPLKMAHGATIDVSDVGTGITFTPATKLPHVSGDAVQALGSGITLERPLTSAHAYGAAVIAPQTTGAGYQTTAGVPAPQQWFGGALSSRAGSLALMDASGTVVVDAVVYGSQQSNSSGNGTITSPELATLVGEQGKGGCIAVVPNAGRGGRGGPAPGASRSIARASDGKDTGSNCGDFELQAPTPGAANQHPQ